MGGAGGPWGLWRHLAGLGWPGKQHVLYSTPRANHRLSHIPPFAASSAASFGASGTAPYIRQIWGGVVKEFEGPPTRENEGNAWSMRCRFFGPATFGPALGFEALEVARPVVDEGHRLGERPVPGDLRNGPVHLLGHPAVRGMALWS